MEQSEKAFGTRDAYFQLKQSYASNWAERWIIPNPLIAPLTGELKRYGVSLNDFAFANEAKTLGEVSLTIAIPSITSAVVVGLDQVLYLAKEPTWQTAPKIVEIFQLISDIIGKVMQCTLASQTSELEFHIVSRGPDFEAATRQWVDLDKVGNWSFCGLSLHKEDASLTLDKSVRHPDAVYLKLQRRFGSDVGIADIALQVLQDEREALKLLGISEVE